MLILIGFCGLCQSKNPAFWSGALPFLIAAVELRKWLKWNCYAKVVVVKMHAYLCFLPPSLHKQPANNHNMFPHKNNKGPGSSPLPQINRCKQPPWLVLPALFWLTPLRFSTVIHLSATPLPCVSCLFLFPDKCYNSLAMGSANCHAGEH